MNKELKQLREELEEDDVKKLNIAVGKNAMFWALIGLIVALAVGVYCGVKVKDLNAKVSSLIDDTDQINVDLASARQSLASEIEAREKAEAAQKAAEEAAEKASAAQKAAEEKLEGSAAAVAAAEKIAEEASASQKNTEAELAGLKAKLASNPLLGVLGVMLDAENFYSFNYDGEKFAAIVIKENYVAREAVGEDGRPCYIVDSAELLVPPSPKIQSGKGLTGSSDAEESASEEKEAADEKAATSEGAEESTSEEKEAADEKAATSEGAEESASEKKEVADKKATTSKDAEESASEKKAAA